jgi:hypothetical protein
MYARGKYGNKYYIESAGKMYAQYYIPVTTTNCDQIFRIKTIYFFLNNCFYLFNLMPWNFLFKVFKISVTRIIELFTNWSNKSDELGHEKLLQHVGLLLGNDCKIGKYITMAAK